MPLSTARQATPPGKKWPRRNPWRSRRLERGFSKALQESGSRGGRIAAHPPRISHVREKALPPRQRATRPKVATRGKKRSCRYPLPVRVIEVGMDADGARD